MNKSLEQRIEEAIREEISIAPYDPEWPRRSRAMEALKERVQESGPRFTYTEDWYDKVAPDEKVYVQYRCFSDGQIQVWGVDIKR